jgi:hypothetical protein
MLCSAHEYANDVRETMHVKIYIEKQDHSMHVFMVQGKKISRKEQSLSTQRACAHVL